MGPSFLIAVSYVLTTTVFTVSGVPIDHLPEVVAKARHIRQADPQLTSRIFDFSRRCPPGVSLTIGTKKLNVRNLRLSFSDAIQVAPILHGQTLDERVDVICRRAQRTQQTALSLGRQPPTVFDIKRFGLFEGDIVLDRELAFNYLSGPISINPNPTPALNGQRFRPRPRPALSNLRVHPFPLPAPPLSVLNPGSIINGGAQPLNPRPRSPIRGANPIQFPSPVGGSPAVRNTGRPGVPINGGQVPVNQIRGAFPGIAPSRRVKPRTLRKKRKITRTRRWPGGVIPYRFRANDFTAAELQGIREGVASWEAKTCIRMPETATVANQDSVVFIKDLGQGCYSYVGRIQNKQQQISIDNGCNSLGIITHEIGHTIGLVHEQSRPDRDRYVTIDTSTVNSLLLGNFEKRDWDFYLTAKVPYDYASVMHYGLTDFSRTTIPEGTTNPIDSDWNQGIGQRIDISFWDAKIVNLMYCNGACGGTSLETNACQNGGYLNPNNCAQCICPPGFAPPTCITPPTPAPACGNTLFLADSTMKTFSSPNYESGVGPSDTDCFFMFQAPANQRVRMNFIDQFAINHFNLDRACMSYVEVRYQTMSLNGPRFCGSTRPQFDFVSHGDKILVRLSALGAGSKGFKIQYQSETCGGCSINTLASDAACLRTNVDLCESQNGVNDNRCFDPLPNSLSKFYCCSGFSLSGETCTNNNPAPTAAPITDGPITGAPITDAPITAAPITDAPITAAPITDAPITAAPITDAPITAAPITDAPITAAPITDAPITAAPITDAPITAAPITDAPITAAPITAAPITDAPITAAPITAAPITAAPITAAPITLAPNTPSPFITAAPFMPITRAPLFTRAPFTIRPFTRAPGPLGGWLQWKPWTQCTKTCGLCGIQYRTRVCQTGPCSGLNFEFRRCAESVCPGIGLRSRFCYLYRFSFCNSNVQCCAGIAIGGRCVTGFPTG